MGDGDRIRVGIYVPQIQLTYDDLVVRARACDGLGFDSFWLFDRASRLTQWHGQTGI